MMSKKEYWKKRWDTIVCPKDASIQDEDTYKLIQLLSEYSGISSSYHWLTFLFCVTNLGWLLQFRWGSHHVSQVINAISEYASEYINVHESIHHNKNYHNVAVVLARLKWQLKNTPLSDQGDLYQILQVVEEKTGVKFDEVNWKQVLSQIEKNEHISRYPNDGNIILALKRIDRKWQYYELYTSLTRLIETFQTECKRISNKRFKEMKQYQCNSLLKLKKLIFDDLELPIDKVYQTITSERYPDWSDWEDGRYWNGGQDNRMAHLFDTELLKYVKQVKFSSNVLDKTYGYRYKERLGDVLDIIKDHHGIEELTIHRYGTRYGSHDEKSVLLNQIIKNNNSLKYLSLDGSYFNLEFLKLTLQESRSIETLKLFIDKDGEEPILGEILRENQSITTLELVITYPGYLSTRFVNELMKNNTIKKLSLMHCYNHSVFKTNTDTISRIIDQSRSITGLRLINLGNGYPSINLTGFKDTLKNNKLIKELDLTGYDLLADTKELIEVFETKKDLKKVRLFDCHISSSVFKALVYNTDLEEFTCSLNEYSAKKDLTQFFKIFLYNKKLSKVLLFDADGKVIDYPYLNKCLLKHNRYAGLKWMSSGDRLDKESGIKELDEEYFDLNFVYFR